MLLINNSLHSPFFIFIKDNGQLSDEELFERLNIKNYELISDAEERIRGRELTKKTYLYVAEDNSWKHLMDGWLYTLWHDPEIRKRIKTLSQEFDIYCCSVGDSDDSFDFIYYQNGTITREYVVEDPDYNGGFIAKDFGQPLDAEENAFKINDEIERVLYIAQSIGININHNLENIRCYGRERTKSEIFPFDETTY